MQALSRSLILLLLTLAAAACGPGIDAVVGSGSVTLEAPDVAPVTTTGPIAFFHRVRLTAAGDGVRVRVACGGVVTEQTTTDGPPAAGIVDFELGDGARIRRRDDFAFDLLEGTAHVRSGVVASRLIVMNARCHISAEPSDNKDGIDVRLTARGDQLRAEVLRGKVLLNATDEEERDTLFVTLEAGDCAVAKMGEAPRKGTTEWFETE